MPVAAAATEPTAEAVLIQSAQVTLVESVAFPGIRFMTAETTYQNYQSAAVVYPVIS